MRCYRIELDDDIHYDESSYLHTCSLLYSNHLCNHKRTFHSCSYCIFHSCRICLHISAHIHRKLQERGNIKGAGRRNARAHLYMRACAYVSCVRVRVVRACSRVRARACSACARMTFFSEYLPLQVPFDHLQPSSQSHLRPPGTFLHFELRPQFPLLFLHSSMSETRPPVSDSCTVLMTIIGDNYLFT